MGTPPTKLHLSILAFFSLTLVIQARLNLDPSDSDAFTLFKNHLGFNGQQNTTENPCYSVGIFCKRSRFPGNPTTHRVNRIVLNSKGLNGFLNPAIGRLSELKELSLPNNHLVDQIPPEISYCGKLQILNLRNNQFSGKIPSEFSSLVSLRVLDLSSNRFSGDLSFLNYLPNLEKIYVSNNLFTGKVPDSVRSLRSLRIIDLSGNSYLQIPLQKSANGVQNFLPKRYMLAEKSIAPSANKSSHSNSTSHEKSIAPSASKSSHSNSTSHEKDKKRKKKKVKGLIIGFIVGVIGGVLSGLLFSFLIRFVATCIRGPEKDSGPTIFSPLIKKAADLAFLEEEDGLASLEIIGRGGCGEVYRAELPGSNGKMIAIKKIVNSQIDSVDVNGEDSKLLNKKMRQIRSEILTVGRIRHRNLLSLLAHVIRPDCHYLVYEYMKNGSLHDILKQVSEGTRELNWLSRHRIALGVAAGLEYLHMNHNPRIIHRDLKPANILLDDDMEARIADFGLAKSIPDAHTHISTSNVAGTIGYIAPEYHQTLKFTDKCDIYSFGVLLGVLVMGKLPSDDFYQYTEEMNQNKWMRNVINSEDPRRAIDPNLLGNGYEEQMLLVLKIVCFCTSDVAKQRPNSKEVRCMLAQVKH